MCICRAAHILGLFAKDCLLTGQEQACTRIIQLDVWLFVRHHAENGLIHMKMALDCPPPVTTFKVKKRFPDQTRKEEQLVQPVFCIVDAESSPLHIILTTYNGYQTR